MKQTSRLILHGADKTGSRLRIFHERPTFAESDTQPQENDSKFN